MGARLPENTRRRHTVNNVTHFRKRKRVTREGGGQYNYKAVQTAARKHKHLIVYKGALIFASTTAQKLRAICQDCWDKL